MLISLQLPHVAIPLELLMAEPVTLRLSGQQAALLAPILEQMCGAEKNQGAIAQVTPQRSVQGMEGFHTPSSSRSTSSSGSTAGDDCVFSLDDLLNPKKKRTKGSDAQKYLNVSDIKITLVRAQTCIRIPAVNK